MRLLAARPRQRAAATVAAVLEALAGDGACFVAATAARLAQQHGHRVFVVVHAGGDDVVR
jgi:hypothetical protein